MQRKIVNPVAMQCVANVRTGPPFLPVVITTRIARGTHPVRKAVSSFCPQVFYRGRSCTGEKTLHRHFATGGDHARARRPSGLATTRSRMKAWESPPKSEVPLLVGSTLG